MSSRGPVVAGTDGSDFNARARILAHYQISALTKKRLQFILIIHLMLLALMSLKLLPNVLDLLEIFWLPLEELEIPPADPWEWAWFSTFAFVLVAFGALKSNNMRNVQVFAGGIVAFGVLPLLCCASLWIKDLKTFVNTRDVSRVTSTWRGYPVAIYWFVFLTVTLQVHAIELYLCYELNKALGNRSVKRKRN